MPRRTTGRGKYDRAQSKADRRGEQRERLLGAAARVFAARGYANASVEKICDAAQMSRRTFYEHFDDLRDVLVELHDKAGNESFRVVEASIRAEPDPLRSLHAGVHAFLSLIAQHGDLARVIFREIRAAGPRYEARHDALIARYVGLLFEGAAAAYAKGAATRPPDEVTVFALVSAMEAVAIRALARREEARVTEAAPALVELVLRAFR